MTKNNSAPINQTYVVDILMLLRKHGRNISFTAVVAGVAAFGLTYLITPKYTTEASILPPQQQSNASAMLGALGGLAALSGGSLGSLKNPADQWVAFLKSQTLADAIIDKFSLMTVYGTEYKFLARKSLAGNSRFTATKEGLISIEIEDDDPHRAAAIASSYIEQLRAMARDMNLTEASQRRAFFEKQFKESQNQLIRAEQALRGSGVGASTLRTNPQATFTTIAELEGKIRNQETSIAVLQRSRAPNNPELQNELTELNSLRAQLASANSKRSSPTSESDDYIAKYREFKYQETLYEMMARQFELAKLDESRDGTIIQIIDPPEVPEYKSSPKRAKIALVTSVITVFIYTIFVFLGNSFKRLGNTPTGQRKIQSSLSGEDTKKPEPS